MQRHPSSPPIASPRRSNSLNAAREQRQRPRPHTWSTAPASLTPPIAEATPPPQSSSRPSTASTSTGPSSDASLDRSSPEPAPAGIFKLVDIPQKGKGLVATRFIPPGMTIFCEAPLFVQPSSTPLSNSSILSILAFKSRDEQTEFFKLTRSAERKSLPALSIFEANALPYGVEGEVAKDGKGQQRGLFLLASRVNHSCSPNVVRTWDVATQCIIVRAIRSIATDEEICVGYGALLGTRETRQAWLSERWGFKCACDVCELQGEEAEHSDRRRESIARLYDEVGKCLKEPTLGIRKVKIALRLLKEESLAHCEASFCFDAFQFCVLVSDFTNAKIWARRAWEASCNTSGPDGAAAHTFKMYWANPRAHRFAGMMPKLTLSGPD